MLPGLRFLFAATLITTSLMVFGMGAIALMRASHQQFASMPPRPPSEPVFAEAPQTVPSLSMLRAEPSPATQPAAPQAERSASLTNAERAADPPPAPPVIAEPKPAEPSADTRSESKPPADPPPMPEVTPLAEKVPSPETPPVAVAEAPVAPETKAPEPAVIETKPAAETAQVATAPEAASPEVTGSVAMPEDQPVEPQVVIVDPPLPQARPDIATLTPAAETAAAKAPPKVVTKRKVRQVAKRRHHRSKVERLPATSSAPTLGSLFGGGSSN
jgi:hypothetical protein